MSTTLKKYEIGSFELPLFGLNVRVVDVLVGPSTKYISLSASAAGFAVIIGTKLAVPQVCVIVIVPEERAISDIPPFLNSSPNDDASASPSTVSVK